MAETICYKITIIMYKKTKYKIYKNKIVLKLFENL